MEKAIGGLKKGGSDLYDKKEYGSRPEVCIY